MKKEVVQRQLWSFDYVTKHLGLSRDELIRLVCDQKLTAKVKAPFIDLNQWDTLDKNAAKMSYGTGSDFVARITIDSDGDTSTWDEPEVKWSLVHFIPEEVEIYKKSITTPDLKIIKSDFTHFWFGGVEYSFDPRRAALIKVLYDKSKTDFSLVKQEDILKLANTELKSSAYGGDDAYEDTRIDKLFRIKPPVLGVVIIRPEGSRAEYRFAQHNLIL